MHETFSATTSFKNASASIRYQKRNVTARGEKPILLYTRSGFQKRKTTTTARFSRERHARARAHEFASLSTGSGVRTNANVCVRVCTGLIIRFFDPSNGFSGVRYKRVRRKKKTTKNSNRRDDDKSEDGTFRMERQKRRWLLRGGRQVTVDRM